MKLNLFGWFPQEYEETLKKLIKEHKIKSVIEIGCFLGKSTNFFVSQGCEVTSIDTFEGASDLNNCKNVKELLPTLYEQFLFNLKELGIENKVKVLKMTSLEASKLNLKADLIFIDGSHEYKDVKDDIKAWKDKAIKILCGDDYTEAHDDVKKAVDEILPQANKNQRVWYLTK